MMERRSALVALSAMANGARLDLLRLLLRQGPGGMAAGDIGRALGHSASRLSFHLAALEQAGLIQSRRDSRNMIYSANPSGLGGIMSFLLKDCFLDHPDVLACCRATTQSTVHLEKDGADIIRASRAS